jgi:CheY-like chemotaxis protein
MDRHLPGIDGLAATRALHALPGGADLPVIGLTGASAAERQECLAAGMREVLLKPVDLARLDRALAAVPRRS